MGVIENLGGLWGLLQTLEAVGVVANLGGLWGLLQTLEASDKGNKLVSSRVN